VKIMWKIYEQRVRGSKFESMIWILWCFNDNVFQTWKLNIKLKILELCKMMISLHKSWFLMEPFFCYEFFKVHVYVQDVNIKLKILELCKITFLSHKSWFLMKYFSCHDFFMFMYMFRTLISLLCTCQKKELKKLKDQKMKDIIFSSMFLLCITL
jgi:hypothetical protein